MTEKEWQANPDLSATFKFLVGCCSDRRLQLFICAGCRANWRLLVA